MGGDGREPARRAQSVDSRRPGPGVAPRARGFTLLEILLALALLGLLSAALVSIAAPMVTGGKQSPEEVFWTASRAARKAALKSEQETRLSFDAKEKRFVVSGAGREELFPVPAVPGLTIDFLQAQSTGGSVLIGGQLVDTATLPAVAFYPDGTCQPFRVQLRTTGPSRFIAIDPWTCSPVLPEIKAP